MLDPFPPYIHKRLLGSPLSHILCLEDSIHPRLTTITLSTDPDLGLTRADWGEISNKTIRMYPQADNKPLSVWIPTKQLSMRYGSGSVSGATEYAVIQPGFVSTNEVQCVHTGLTQSWQLSTGRAIKDGFGVAAGTEALKFRVSCKIYLQMRYAK